MCYVCYQETGQIVANEEALALINKMDAIRDVLYARDKWLQKEQIRSGIHSAECESILRTSEVLVKKYRELEALLIETRVA